MINKYFGLGWDNGSLFICLGWVVFSVLFYKYTLWFFMYTSDKITHKGIQYVLDFKYFLGLKV